VLRVNSLHTETVRLNQSVNQSNFLGGLSSGTTARSTGDSLCPAGSQEKTSRTGMCWGGKTKCGQWFCCVVWV